MVGNYASLAVPCLMAECFPELWSRAYMRGSVVRTRPKKNASSSEFGVYLRPCQQVKKIP